MKKSIKFGFIKSLPYNASKALSYDRLGHKWKGWMAIYPDGITEWLQDRAMVRCFKQDNHPGVEIVRVEVYENLLPIKSPRKAPWTKAQVKMLKEYQGNQFVHPYTCGGIRAGGKDCRQDLIPTKEGWICPTCGYKQDWY